eukprot:15237830-Alexandrium_andersonii.AAC.1
MGHAARRILEFPSEGWRRPARLRESDFLADPRSELPPSSLFKAREREGPAVGFRGFRHSVCSA